MVGAIRNERSKTSKFYERKVRFEQEPDELFSTSTPSKKAAPTLVAGAESHKRQKRKSVSAARRGLSAQADEDAIAFFTYPSEAYPKTPVRKSRTARRYPLPTDMDVEELADRWSPQDPSSSPFGKTLGKPDVSDFSDMPDVSYLDAAFPPGKPFPGMQSTSVSAPLVKEKLCRCTELEEENVELRRKFDALNRKHQELKALVKDIRVTYETQGSISSLQIQDVMLWDADDDFEPSSISHRSAMLTDSTPYDPFAPTPELSFSRTPSTSMSLSPTGAEAGTPVESPAMPVRVLDEDYDEGYDHRAARLENIRLGVASKLGLTPGMSMEQTVDRLTDALAAQWRITDNSSAPNIVFPPLTLPPIPQFNL